MILLVIDVQKLIMTDDLYDFARFENTVGKLICAARESGTEVVYVRHDDGEGEELTKGKAGFEIYDGFKPQPGEKSSPKPSTAALKKVACLNICEKNKQKKLRLRDS